MEAGCAGKGIGMLLYGLVTEAVRRNVVYASVAGRSKRRTAFSHSCTDLDSAN